MAGMAYAATGEQTSFARGDVSNGIVDMDSPVRTDKMVELPESFDPDAARAELVEARMSGNSGRASELARMIHAWWELNSDRSMDPMEHGSNPDPGPYWRDESHRPNGGSAVLWWNDVRIDPNTGVRDVKLASLSNGELYAHSIWKDGSDDHDIIHRSTDDGLTWTIYRDWNAGTSYDLSSPGVFVSEDTLVFWYILEENSSGDMRAWVKVTEPGPAEVVIFFGSPTGVFMPVDYRDLHVTTDGWLYTGDAYVYATWTERYGAGPDSTRVMSAVSHDHDVSNWDVGPTTIRASSGANIYYLGTRTAYGNTADSRLWTVAWLHPSGYPGTWDRLVRGWYSDDYGTSWSSPVDITPPDNAQDEYDPSIAGSHSNAYSTWVVLATQNDTSLASDRDVNNWYSTDAGDNWTLDTWVTNSFENYLGDVWVDIGSMGFWAALRQDRTGVGEEYVRYKGGDISDPTTWTGSVGINDDPTDNLSAAYGPSVSYNEGTGDAIIAWNSFEGSVYSIWFDAQGWPPGVEEGRERISSAGFINLAPNPSRGAATLTYIVKNEGNVRVSLYDTAGRLVNNLVDGRKAAGTHSIDINGGNLASGVYFIRIKTPEGSTTREMTVVK